MSVVCRCLKQKMQPADFLCACNVNNLAQSGRSRGQGDTCPGSAMDPPQLSLVSHGKMQPRANLTAAEQDGRKQEHSYILMLILIGSCLLKVYHENIPTYTKLLTSLGLSSLCQPSSDHTIGSYRSDADPKRDSWLTHLCALLPVLLSQEQVADVPGSKRLR